MVFTGSALTPQVKASFTDKGSKVSDRILDSSVANITFRDAGGNTVSEIVAPGTYTAQIIGDGKSVFGTQNIEFKVVDPNAGKDDDKKDDGGTDPDDGNKVPDNKTPDNTNPPAGDPAPAGQQGAPAGNLATTGDNGLVAGVGIVAAGSLSVLLAGGYVLRRRSKYS